MFLPQSCHEFTCGRGTRGRGTRGTRVEVDFVGAWFAGGVRVGWSVLAARSAMAADVLGGGRHVADALEVELGRVGGDVAGGMGVGEASVRDVHVSAGGASV